MNGLKMQASLRGQHGAVTELCWAMVRGLESELCCLQIERPAKDDIHDAGSALRKLLCAAAAAAASLASNGLVIDID